MVTPQHYRLVPPPALVTAPPALDEDQRAVVAHGAGPLLVLAGPGTGKTTTLVESVVARVEAGCPAESVLVLTFSRKAAAELRERIAARLGRTSTLPRAMTFHSFCYALVRRFGGEDDSPAPGGAPPLRLLTAPEQDFRLRELLVGQDLIDWPRELHPALPTRGFASQLRGLWARARQLGMDPVDLAALGEAAGRDEWVAAGSYFEEYLDVLGFEGSLDYGELVHRSRLLLTDDAVLDAVRRELRWVYVDEYQDTDPAQVGLLRRLVGRGGNIVAVGDPDQSIYRFRGAEPRALGQFGQEVGDGGVVPVVTLRRTRRFGADIAAAAARVADRLPLLGGIDREVLERFRHPVAEGPAGEVRAITYDTEGAQAAHVAALLREAHLREGIAWQDMAVLVRSGRRSIPALTRALVASGVPVEVAGDEIPLAGHLAVRPLLEALSVVAGVQRMDVASGQRLLMSPLGGLDALGWRRLGRLVRERERDELGGAAMPRPAGEIVAELLQEPALLADLPATPEVARVAALAELLARTRRVVEAGGTAHEALWSLWSATPWHQRLQAEAATGGEAGRRADRDLDAVCALFDLASRKELVRNQGVRALLADVESQQIPADTNREADTRQRGVRVLTAHRAKGLEWDLVVVAGVQEGVWPDVRASRGLLDAERLTPLGIAEPEPLTAQLAEERRLFYVACTRARRRLVVTAVEGTEGEGDQPSRFLADLGVEVERRAGWPERPLTLTTLVAELRRASVDPAASPAVRAGAAARLARLAQARDERDRPVAPLADPRAWWGLREPSDAEPVRVAAPGEPVVLSGSALESLLDCPRRWFLERRVHAESGGRTSATLGSVIHRLADLATGHDWGLADMTEHLETVWDQIPFEAEWYSASQRVQAEAALARFVGWADRNPRELIGSELPFDVEVDVPGDRVRLTGAVDRLERGPDGIHVVDIKTGKHAIGAKDVPTMSQLGVYQLAVAAGAFDEVTSGDRRLAGASAVYLRDEAKDGGPTERVQASLADVPVPEGVEVTAGAATWVHEQLARAAAIVREGRFPAQRCTSCQFCAFESSCPAQPGGKQVLS